MASPNSKKPLVGDQSPTGSGKISNSPPPSYTDEGYIGSKVTLIRTNGDHCEIVMPINNTKNQLEMDDSSSDTSSSSNTSTRCMQVVETITNTVDDFLKEHKTTIKRVIYAVLIIAFHVYSVIAIVLDYDRATLLIVFICIAYFFVAYNLLKGRLADKISTNVFVPVKNRIDDKWYILKWFVYLGLMIFFIIFLATVIRPEPHQLISFGGMAMFIIVLFIFSRHPSKVNWRPVIWGMGLQFTFGVLILRWSEGFKAFNLLGQQVNTFLNYSSAGAVFVFGKNYAEHFFAFKILPVIVFFSCIISTLYHLGVMQVVIGKIAWVMQKTMGTAPTESLSCAANIFIGQTEAPILIRPFLKDMTKSELHAVMTGGFATIAGSVMAAYVLGYHIPAEHLLCASVMNAPIALGVSKLFYPETEESPTKDIDNIEMDKGSEGNVIEAAAAGATQSIGLVANIAANLIAFLAMLQLVNAVLGWFGSLVGYPQLTFQVICSYLFMPVAFMMGVSWDDAGIVAELLGTKLFINEFIAYEKLSEYMANRQLCQGEFISSRSEIIATYALCGFANLSSIGIQLGGIGPMAPSRKKDLAEIAMRALIAGTIATLMTACVAGILTSEGSAVICPINNSTLYNQTMNGTLSLNGTETLTFNNTYTILNANLTS